MVTAPYDYPPAGSPEWRINAAIELLSVPGPATAAQALALAILSGEITPPSQAADRGADAPRGSA